MALLSFVYHRLLPDSFRLFCTPYIKNYRTQQRLRRIRYYKRCLSKTSRRQRQLSEIHAILKQRPLRVAFQIAQLGKWKNETLFRLMQQSKDFEPLIWLRPVWGYLDESNAASIRRDEHLIREHFKTSGVSVFDYEDADSFPAEIRPDVIFIHEPYDGLFIGKDLSKLENDILCYVPYGFRNSVVPDGYDSIGTNGCVFQFYENMQVAQDASVISTNRGKNIVVTGNPIADLFMEPTNLSKNVWKSCGSNMKKVIWAPHWSIMPDLSWFAVGTFLKNADAMLALAHQYEHSIQFAFKPHPLLYKTLCEHPDWGKEKTDAYYKEWQNIPNGQLEEGEYAALFMQSDAMIHDSGSFILEYLYADKPAMYLVDGAGFDHYNKMTSDALECYHKGHSGTDIDYFLRSCVLGCEDSRAEHRAYVRKTYLLPPHGKSAAQNIIDTFLSC